MDHHVDEDLTKNAPNLIKRIENQLQNLQKKSDNKEIIDFNTHINPLLLDIDQFQQGPHFLDSILEKTILFLSKPSTNESWKYLIFYQIVKVRGYKVVGRFIPVNVDLLEDTVNSLYSIDSKTPWQKQYFLLLQLSMLILLPFSLDSFGEQMPEWIYNLALSFLSHAGKELDAAAIVMARFITRPDTKKLFLKRFYNDATELWSRETKSDSEIRLRRGILQSSSLVLSLTDNTDIIELKSEFFSILLQTNSNSSFERKFIVKNLGRYGLSCLGSQEIDLEMVEIITGQLFNYVQDSDTVVRYSASKAIARIVEELPKPDLARQVIMAIYNMFEDDMFIDSKTGLRDVQPLDKSKWHGALLCLAELLRRRLLDSSLDLKPLVDTILPTSLSFEQKQISSFTSGTNIRDASCYVCWALSRAYRSIDEKVLEKMLSILVCAACYDREVTVRRAAGAAIQEMIGRHDNILKDTKKRIELVKNMDFFSLGSRTNSFLKVSKIIYNLGFHDIMDFALKHPLRSSDSSVRRLAARSVSELAIIDDRNQESIEYLLSIYDAIDIDIAHGIIYCLGGLISTLKENDEKIGTRVVKILDSISINDLTGPNEIIYSDAFANLFGRSVIKFQQNFFSEYQSLLENKFTLCMIRNLVIGRKNNSMKDNADLQSCMNEVQQGIINCSPSLFSNEIIENWIKYMMDGKEEFAMAFGNMGHVGNLDYIVDALKIVVKGTKKAGGLTRAAATKSLCKLTLERNIITEEDITLFLLGLDDFTVSRQGGEVGSFVRIESIRACQQLWNKYKNSSLHLNRFKLIFISRLLRMSLEVLDKVRSIAAKSLLETFPEILGNKQVSERLSNILQDGNYRLNDYFDLQLHVWSALDDDLYKNQFVLGAIRLCGAIHGNEHVLRNGVKALITLLDDGHWNICFHFLKYLDLRDANGHGSRLSLMSARTWQRIVESGLEIPEDLIKKLTPKIIDLSKVADDSTVCISILVELLTMSQDSEILNYLSTLLDNNNTTIRVLASEAIFSYMINDDKWQEIINLMEDIDFESTSIDNEQIHELQKKLAESSKKTEIDKLD